MMSSGEQTALFLRLMTILMPLGVYFLLLGLLNSRRHPQLLSGRRDFTLLMAAFSPMLILPVLSALSLSWWSGLAVMGAVVGLTALGAPRTGRWVIYNLPADQARAVVRRALEAEGLAFEEVPGGFLADEGRLGVQISAFGLLHNVSIRLSGPDRHLQQGFCRAVAAQLRSCQAQTCPATVAMMMVAIAMMVAPLVLVAHRAGDIVRIVVDLLP